MQTQEVVTGLPKFKMNDMQNVCEACQIGKQSGRAFAKERNVSERPLQVIHSDVWKLHLLQAAVLCDLH